MPFAAMRVAVSWSHHWTVYDSSLALFSVPSGTLPQNFTVIPYNWEHCIGEEVREVVVVVVVEVVGVVVVIAGIFGDGLGKSRNSNNLQRQLSVLRKEYRGFKSKESKRLRKERSTSSINH